MNTQLELLPAEQRVYITITTKPLAVASIERLPYVETNVMISALSGDDLLAIVSQSLVRIGGNDGAA